MTTITVSPESQIIVPSEICENLGLRPGAEVRVIAVGDRIEIFLKPAANKPPVDVKAVRGILKGINTTIYLDDEHA